MKKLSLEQIFIGEAISSPEQLNDARTIIPDGSFFSDPKCGDMYEAILRTFDKNGSVDLVLIHDEWKRNNLSEADIIEWSNAATKYDRLSIHARKLAEQYMKKVGSKSLLNLCNDFKDNPDPFEAIDESIATLSGLRSQFKKEHAVSMATIAGEAFEEIDKIRNGQQSSSLPFGFTDIDQTTGGMDKGDLVVIAALEKRGKSTLLLQILFNLAKKGIPCLFFSTEMKRKQILFRYALLVEEIPWIDVKNNRLSQDQWNRLAKRINIIASYPLFIRDGVLTISDIYSDAERFVQERNVKVVAVDYIQRVVPISKKSNENREREIAAISSGLKNIAIQFDIPVIALSQLNKELNARESMAIEQDMDKMITIDKPENDTKLPNIEGFKVNIKIRQRLGLSGGFSDNKLYYDLLNGSWKNYYGGASFVPVEEPIEHETENLF
jgi:replicative DNA helicase